MGLDQFLGLMSTQEAALLLQRELIAAARRRDKRSALQAADEALHELRMLLRQGQALNCSRLASTNTSCACSTRLVVYSVAGANR